MKLPVLVINDGCTDRTAGILDAWQNRHTQAFTHIDLASNRGKGAALQLGMEEALNMGFTHAISMDSDGQHDPSDLPAFLKAIEQRPEDLILGIRQLQHDHRWKALKSRLLRMHSNLWVLLAGRKRVADSQSGYRCYPLSKALRLPLSTSRYDFEIEILIQWLWNGQDTCELPVKTYYPHEGKSHFRLWSDSLKVMRLFISLTLHTLARLESRATIVLPFRLWAFSRLKS